MNILFTGCSTGFGKYIYKELKDRAHRVVGVGLNGPDVSCDFRDPQSLDKAWLLARELVQLADGDQGFQAVINNAGMTHIAPFTEHTLGTDYDVLGVNLMATLFFSRKAIAENPAIRLINTSSMSIYMGMRYSTSYVASKAAVEAATRCLAREYAAKGLFAACVAPGIVEDTEMSAQAFGFERGALELTSEQVLAKVREKNPIGRMCKHDELWEVYRWLLFEAPMFASGTTIKVPGGAGC